MSLCLRWALEEPEQLLPPRQQSRRGISAVCPASFCSDFHSGMRNSHRTTLASRNTCSIHSPLAARSRAIRQTSFVKKHRSSSGDASFNCTNVYPHVETATTESLFSYEEDVDMDEDELTWLKTMRVETSTMLSDFSLSESDDSGCDYDSDDFDFSSLVDQARENELLIEFGHKPRVFDGATSMKFYISALAITQLSAGLWTRSRPACVIINTSIPRRTRFDDMDWSADALRMLNTPNAGGSSLLSEVLSCEMLNRCLGATLAKTEMEIRYLFAYQPITDYTVTLPNLSPRMHVGVSVTRAFAFKGAYRKSDCRKLLWKKLTGILASTRNVLNERFFKQILHVWVPNGKVARTVQATYKSLPEEVTRNTVVIISVVNAAWVFTNRR
ncbi:hypothetical protein BGZ99_004931 [Dissophora globulifera]|uniref:Uncharacterized protein n=1 Tax=Dissophora globulifera TaxID=979702 RepID=A0A9P6UU69_9FUNG|nr:hypothetical protein BGZ99_004931 [Dissophora globulifera]